MEHIPVLLDECLDGLNIKPDGIYVDGTLGRGGHAKHIAERLETGRLIAIDCDNDAIEEARAVLSEYRDKVTLIRGNFRNTAKILEELKIKKTDGMLFDLGVSSPQLDNVSRGFSYKQDAPLDMRMDTGNTLTAFEIVNKRSRDELTEIFFKYGEEKYARRISAVIAKNREKAPINTTYQLNDIICSAIPAAARREHQHPSKRCFQALRIAVGDELGALSDMLGTVLELLEEGGRICIISFHSLEDRIVKQAFKEYAQGCICPKDIPVCVCGQAPKMKLITRKPITASDDEIKRNSRARSAKLRIAEKV